MRILLLVVIAFSVFVGLIMEFYKKKVRRDNADTSEISMVSWSFSVLFGIVTFMITPTPPELKSTWLLALLYSVLIHLFQLPACQAVWKPILRKWIERKADV